MSEHGARIFRNNVGLFDTKDGRKIKIGICIGSSDLIGWTSRGKFLAIEVKQPGKKATTDQLNFINAVNKAGGVAFIATSPEEAIEKLLIRQ